MKIKSLRLLYLAIFLPVFTFNILEAKAAPVSQMQKPSQPTTTLPPQVSQVPSRKQSLCDQTIKIRSWKGDYLHRPDSESGVTTWNTGVGNEWEISKISNRQIMLKSWKGDYLHRPDSESGVTTWNTGVGDKWVIEIVN